MSEALGPAAALLARGRVYGLLARLLLRGLDADTLATLQALEWLVPAHTDLDELAAAHHRCFHLELFPYAGVFLDPSARAGASADLVRRHYARAGFHVRVDELGADHLGIALSFASFVSAGAGEALEDGEFELAARLLEQLAEFFDEAVLSWLPALIAASRSLGGYWPRVLDAALELIAEQRAALPGPRAPSHDRGARADILADARTGLRRVCEQLLVPCSSGLCLTRSDLARLARSRSLPRGFGSRVLMLDNLLRSAVDYGELPQLLAQLRALLDARETCYAELGEALDLDAELAPWRAALRDTHTLLETLARAAA